MALNIKPLADRVIIEPAAAETQTASGIIIPDTAKEKPQKGTVVAVGNGKKDEPLTHGHTTTSMSFGAVRFLSM